MAKNVSFHHQRKVRKPSPLKNKEVVLTPLSTFYVNTLLGRKLLAILFAPTKPLFRLALLGGSLWLGLGAAIFGSFYLRHVQAYEQRLQQRQPLLVSQSTWKRILTSHPTSREALLGAYAASYALGENERATRYLELLERIDPNDLRVKNLITK